MRLLQRYVLLGFVRAYLTALLSLAAFYLLIDALSNMDEFARGTGAEAVLEYYANLLPTILYQVSPAAALVGVLMRVGRLSRDNEVLAMRAAGISPARIVAPIVAAGVGIALGAALLGEFVVTTTAIRADTIYREEIRRKRPARTTERIENLVGEHAGTTFYIGALDLRENTMRTFNMTRAGEGIAEEDVNAESAAWDGTTWVLHNGVRRIYSPDGNDVVLEEKFDSLEIGLNLAPDELALSAREPQSLRLGELKRQIVYVRRQGNEPADAIYEIHMRLAAPLANLVTVLLGLIFALNLHRGGAIAGFGIAIGFSIVYYLVVVLCQTMHEGKVLLPELAAWLPNALFGAGAIVGFALYQKRH